jgi:cystathionine gamma-synthase
MRGFGGVVSFDMKGGRTAIDAFIKALKIFKLAESFGGV